MLKASQVVQSCQNTKCQMGVGGGGEEARQTVARSGRCQLKEFLLYSKGNREPLGHFEQDCTGTQITLKKHLLWRQREGQGVKTE